MDPFIGTIMMFAGNFAPRGWALCDGQVLPIASNQALFSVIGASYGGDGRTTFALPDLRGRFSMHPGLGPGLKIARRLGEKRGEEAHTLSVEELPPHTHVATATAVTKGTDASANTHTVDNSTWAQTPADTNTQIYARGGTPGVVMNAANVEVTVTNANAGGGQPFLTTPPFQCVNYIIALVGTFPSRS